MNDIDKLQELEKIIKSTIDKFNEILIEIKKENKQHIDICWEEIDVESRYEHFGHIDNYAKWLKANNKYKKYCLWNGRIYKTKTFLDDFYEENYVCLDIEVV